jgi:putative membrane protein
MVVWDMSMDPLRATLEGRWVWLDGGVHFGVPLSNFFGWFGVTWLMFQCFALSLYRMDEEHLPAPINAPLFWVPVPIAYSAFAGEYLLNPFVDVRTAETILINGEIVRVHDMLSSIAGICAVTIIPLAMLGIIKALRPERAADGSYGQFAQARNARQ